MTTLNIEGRKVKVSDDFLSLSPEEQERTVEEIASSLSPNYPLMSQVNKGISETVGGLVDFVNPFDEYTGSAVKGIENTFGALGTEFAQSQPDNIAQGMARGAGQAAGSLVPVAKGLQALKGAGGVVGQFADDALRALATVTGATAEVVAGGISGGAEETAEQLGAPEWVQDTAAIAAPMSVPAALGTAKAAARISPVGTAVRRGAAALAPYTRSGAKGVATERMQALAGGPKRAEELAARISGDNPLNLTPSQRTEDTNMLAIENLAGEQDPELRAYLEQRKAESADLARQKIAGMGGDVGDAQRFFDTRRRDFTARLQAQADEAMGASADRVQGIASTAPDSANSQKVTDQIRVALDNAILEERQLWAKIPQGEMVGTGAAKAKAQALAEETSHAQRPDIPQAARELLENAEVYGDTASVREMYGLYSELQRVARSAMAGNDQNKNRARIANEIADAILEDLGAKAGATATGQKINEARAFSAALHETFDRGAPGRLLKRTLDGDTAIDPELALNRTVGRGGVEGAVTSRQIEEAGGAPGVIQDYIAGQFSNSATNPGTGEVSISTARRWMARNRELLNRYPELRDEIEGAVAQRETAEQLSERITRRIGALEDKRKSVVAGFLDGQAEKAYTAITEAKRPIQAARRIANEARRDPSGKALAGLKASFANHLIDTSLRTSGSNTALDATALNKALSDPKLNRAMGAIFSEGEMSRLRFVGRELAKAQAGSGANVGSDLSNAAAPRWIQIMARVAGAKTAVKMADTRNAGDSLQAANIGANRAAAFVKSLTADRASQMIADAITDTELFRALLTQTGSVQAVERTIPKFLPYLLGGSTAAASQ